MNPPMSNHVLWVARWGLHLLVAGLLVLAVARSLTATSGPGAGSSTGTVLALAVVTGLVYTAGPLTPSVSRSRRAAVVWLAVLGLAWLGLLVTTADGVWLAFPLFFLQLHLLPRRMGAVVVAATTVAAVAGFSWHQGDVEVAYVIGPALGALFAVVTVWGYQALYAESERRRGLIEELTATRSELAAAEHNAGVLAERERLATEVHDTVAQGLSSIQLLLRAAERTVSTNPVTALGQIQKARVSVQTNLAEARRFVRAGTPVDLDAGSLPEALQRLCDTTAAQSGVDVHLRCSEADVRLPSPVEVTLLRIAQSAVANAVQHAHANRIEVTLSVLSDAIVLDVVDDGVGFDPDAMAAGPPLEDGTGFGLPAMRARARAQGGSLVVESSPGDGTALALSIPEASRWGQPHE